MAANVNASWDKEVWIGAHSTQNGGDSFAWSDYSEFNVDNWAQYQPDEVEECVLSTLWCLIVEMPCIVDIPNLNS